MIIDTSKSPYAKVKQNDFAVETTSGIIDQRRRADKDVMVPHVLSIFADKNSFFHEVENFRIAAGEADGDFRGNQYGDGDFYKLLEACVYFGMDVSEFIALIGRAQQSDGYLSTKQIIAEKKGKAARHSNQDDFEEYNFGHMFTSACIHYRKTGDESFLNIAKRTADYLYNRYKLAISEKKAMTAVCPSHYMGLVELYRTTGDKKYLEAADMAIKIRDYVEDGTDDNQDAIKLKEQRKMHGHAVRATYLYAGVADLYLETGDEELKTVLDSCWDNLINTKMYINGGLGALYTGASPFGDLINSKRVHQAFGYEYQLPNITAYNETCGSLGGVFWASRMYAIEPKSEYMDFIERVVYNLAMAAVNTKGDKYFYENMLRRTQTVDYFLMWPRERKDDFKCFCCPTNITRFMAEVPEYAFSVNNDTVYTGLYMGCKTHFELDCGANFDLEEITDYPWSGEIKFKITNWNGVPFRFMARIPGWAGGGYRELDISDPHVEFEMKPMLIRANPKLEENENSVCVQRGPIVYCMEEDSVEGYLLNSGCEFDEYELDVGGERVIALKTRGCKLESTCEGLYEQLKPLKLKETEIRLIPYFSWDNSGFKEMRIWIPYRY